MAGSSSTQASQSSFSVGSSSISVVRILSTNRNPELWQHFDLCEMSNGSKKARCKNCAKFLAADGNTNLKNHLTKHCKVIKDNPAEDQAQMSHDGGVFDYNVERVRERMAQFVIQQALPFNHFDNPRLTNLIQETLQPRYHHVSRSTLRLECLKMWKKAKQDLINGFAQLNTGVNLTTDVWSAPHGLPESYLCVTAHWVDPVSWQMMKRVIAFELFAYPHTGENLFHILDYVINVFGLRQKIFSISFDNASNNTSAVQKLKLKYQPCCNGIFFHSRCTAHIINLVVQDGLNCEVVKDIKDRFKTMLRDVFSVSKARRLKYRKLCHDTDSLCLGPNWEVPTRWNSTWKMFDSAVRQKDTLVVFHNLLVERGRAANPFTFADWETIEKLTELLQVFKTATTYLSGVYYPTSSWILQQLYLMCNKLNDFGYEGEIFEQMIIPMKLKFQKYFTEIAPVVTCVAALNPCYNVAGVETLIDSIVHDLGLEDESPYFARNAKLDFNTSFGYLFDYYLAKYGTTTHIHQSMGSSSSGSSKNPMMSLYNTLRNENSKRARGNTPSSELGRYSGTDFISTIREEEFEDFDVLAWWQARESQFPVLAAMARDLLTVQASTVASESAFSLSGRVLSIRRTRLTPESLETCICLKDHLDAAERIQHVSTLEEELDVEEEIHTYEVEQGAASPLSDEELAYDASQRGSSGSD